ncbi:MAG: hypothetical protein EP343_25095 [Deltaproteobacteria bacterium]|nr:MAG: hypothetical protein EP343_25095 [Deltaproteobacteria bacterium]
MDKDNPTNTSTTKPKKQVKGVLDTMKEENEDRAADSALTLSNVMGVIFLGTGVYIGYYYGGFLVVAYLFFVLFILWLMSLVFGPWT